jgi:energy-coupling factor transporter ATP-binding protein EcfA2
MVLFKWRKRLSRWDQELVFASLGKEKLRLREAYEGIAILGGTGSGKTTCSGFAILCGLLRHAFGALILINKPDEVDRMRRLVKSLNREEDLCVFDEEHGSGFNFIDYLSNLSTTGMGGIQQLVYIFEELTEMQERVSNAVQSRGDEQFWKHAMRRQLTMCMTLLKMATGQITVSHLIEILRDAPQTVEEANSEAWANTSVVCDLLKIAEANCATDAERFDFAEVKNYFTHDLPRLSSKTRATIETGVLNGFQLFSSGTLKRLFCEKTTITPDNIIREGKIVVLNLPVKQMFGLGIVGQTIFKTCFQMRVEQRRPDEDRPCVVWIDEAQQFLNMRDQLFAATARSSKVANVWLTQNLSNIVVAMGGGDAGKASADSLMGLAMTKIFHSNSDNTTNQFASDLIGRRRIRMRSMSVTPEKRIPFQILPQQSNVNVSYSEQFEYIVPPDTFTKLVKAGYPHGYSEAIVFQAGRVFSSTNEPFTRVAFKQGF